MTSAIQQRQRERVETLPLTEAKMLGRMPSIDRVLSLMPGFVYVFNHVTFSNDYSNRSIAEYLGYSSEEIRAFGAQMLMEIVHPDDYAELTVHLKRIAQLADETAVTFEYRVITKTGQERWLRSVDTVFERGQNGNVLRHIGCASDITVEKETQLHLSQLNAELEQKVALRTKDLAQLNAQLEERISARTSQLQDAVDELEQLAYVATHDLKVPINNLNQIGLMLKDEADTLTPDQTEQVEWINECVEQLGSKVQGLVEVAQIRMDSGPLTEPVCLQTAVSDAIAAMGEDGRVVSVDVPADISTVFAKSEVDHILAALLDNALKYSAPSRPVKISLRAGVANGQVWLCVADNGSGLDVTNDLGKVFGLFQRAHKAPAGRGVSLYCAQRMLNRRGGHLTATGSRDKGAEFTIFFPKEETSE